MTLPATPDPWANISQPESNSLGGRGRDTRPSLGTVLAAALVAACLASLYSLPVLAVWALVKPEIAAISPDGAQPETTDPPPANPATTRPTTTSMSGGPHAALSVASLLAPLQIDDGPDPGGYRRDLFPTWLDLDGNGCDTRDDVLAAESEIPATRSGCNVISGRWVSIYDERVEVDPTRLDIDHLVPLAEAWRSGAAAWTAERRARFANHVDAPDHLIAVTASSNRSKGDRPPNEWRPPAEASWCRYATSWVQIKIEWQLHASTRERDALGTMLETC